MPTNDPIAAARREAKTRARSGSLTHQQALDAIAREKGHDHWSAMLAAHPEREPHKELPPGILDVPFMKAPTPDRDVAAGKRAFSRISDWIGERMRAAAEKGMRAAEAMGPARNIRPLPMDALAMAQAMDPDRGDFEPKKGVITVHCPLHDDRNPSLAIAGAGWETSLRCHAGCAPQALNEEALSRLTGAAGRAVAFMKSNDASPVVEGWTRGREGEGGRGGCYRLDDGTLHELDVLTCRLLPDGYPRWLND